ncbi:hypothetical protein Tco_1158926, partial [Tanacetum coccineum]
ELVAQKDQFQPDVKSVGSSSHTVESANNVDDQFSTGSIENIQKKKESGSILKILEEMISVGQTMGFSMKGSIKDMERIIDLKGAETKAEKVFDMEIKELWGNTNSVYAIVSSNLSCNVLGDFNEVRRKEERWGSIFNVYGARDFNHFITSAGLVEVQLEGRRIKIKLKDIDKLLDQLGANDDLLSVRSELLKQYHDIHSVETRESIQKAKIKWVVEGDENSKFFHGMITENAANFASGELEAPISRDEIRRAVWDCGENKSPGPDGFTFEFFRKFLEFVGPVLCLGLWSGSFHHSLFSCLRSNVIGIMHNSSLFLFTIRLSINLKIISNGGLGVPVFMLLNRAFFLSGFALSVSRSIVVGTGPREIRYLLVLLLRLANDIARQLFVIGGAWFGTLLIRIDLGYLGLIWFSFNQVQNKCWKECFTLPGRVSGHIETISSSLIQIFEKMVFLKT